MDIVIIAHFSGALDGKGNGRFLYLAEMLAKEHEVELITTDFAHGAKKKRQTPAPVYRTKMTLLHEHGYPKNVCLQRFVSHHEFGKNVAAYLKTRKKPDVLYCGVPSLDCAAAAADYCGKNGVRFIVDVQDIWPEAFRMVFHVPVLSNLFFAPMERTANRIYGAADAICAVSETYAARALRVNRKCDEGHSVYLGTHLAEFDRFRDAGPAPEKQPGQVVMGYVGTLGHSYDLTCVFDAMALLRERGVTNLNFTVMGDGPLRQKFEDYAKGRKLSVDFTGMLPYPEMVARLCRCDFAVNPISRGAAGSVINKVGDYAAAGLAVVNTQECPEYRKLVTEYEMGFNCANNDANDLADAMERLTRNESLCHELGANNRRLARERFDRAVSYQTLLHVILNK